jgi:CRP/FNR family transcriptional regulator
LPETLSALLEEAARQVTDHRPDDAEEPQYDRLMAAARAIGRDHAEDGRDLADAVRAAVQATNTIELGLLEANEGDVAALTVVNAVAELRSMILMGVAEGYDLRGETRSAQGAQARDALRAGLVRDRARYTTLRLAQGDEIEPLYTAASRFFFVVSGRLRIYNLLPNGRMVTLAMIGPDDVFLQWRAEDQSLSCICAEAPAPADVIAVDERDLADLLAAHPAAAVDAMAGFARRITASQALIEDLMNDSVDLRLYRTLLEYAHEFGRADGEAVVIDVPLTHQRLADMIGSNRVTITRKLQELQNARIIETRRNSTIALLERAALERMARA